MDAPASAAQPAASQPAPVPPAPPAPPAFPGGGSGYDTAVYGVPAPAASAYGSPAHWATPARQNVLAWVSFGLAFAGLMFGPLSSIAAIVCGHLARRQVRERGEQGDGAALTGLIVGYVVTGLWVVGFVLYVLFIVAIFAVSTTAGTAYSTP